MPVLRPITETEFEAWLAEAVPAYAADKVASGAWAKEEALELSRREYVTLLPAGSDTADNYLFSILGSDGVVVGTLWFAAKDKGGSRIAYVYDVIVWPRHQRQGHAMRAFEDLESEVGKLGLAGIALHVFGHNLAARALYEKLGYTPTNINLYKPLGDAVE